MRDSYKVAQKLIKDALAAGKKSLLEPEAKALISAWEVTVPKSIFIKGPTEIISGIKGLSPPFVLKVVSPDISHKSDVGGVMVDLKDNKVINEAMDRIISSISQKAPKAKVEGFIIEETAPRGVEVIIGGLRDQQFGPVVMFGIGGLAVEVMKDVSYRLAPISKKDALNMMEDVKSYPLLIGFRGSKPVDLDKLADNIVAVSEIITKLEGIREIEINPLIAYENGAIAVDARVGL